MYPLGRRGACIVGRSAVSDDEPVWGSGRRQRASARRAAVLVVASAAWAGGVVGLTPDSTAGATPSRPPASAPLTSALVDPTGRAWLVVPMGDLSQAANTFWQVLERPSASAPWALVTPPGVADNGGLVATAGPGGAVVSFLPSQSLRFTPLASTTDGGASWVAGLVPAALDAAPDALAATGSALWALVDRGGRLLAGRSSGGAWRTVLTSSALADSAAGRRCQPRRLLAVAAGPGDTALLAAACRRPGEAGLFAQSATVAGGVSTVAVAVPSTDRVRVLRLVATGAGSAASAGAVALLAEETRVGASLVVASLSPGGRTSLSGDLRLDGRRLVATGSGPGGELYVLLRTPAGAEQLTVEAAGRWDYLPAPPRGTVAVALSPGRTDVVTVHSSTLTDYTLDPAVLLRWRRTQVLRVPVQYGSSS